MKIVLDKVNLKKPIFIANTAESCEQGILLDRGTSNAVIIPGDLYSSVVDVDTVPDEAIKTPMAFLYDNGSFIKDTNYKELIPLEKQVEILQKKLDTACGLLDDILLNGLPT